ncbi:hypothetical protein ACFR9U_20945 [Halorientalis brevis]|uniref:CDC48 N-terminal subdomain domain-containing protein n=1 Tax=Halorientalis brevis TaxID=1126241 RepID=A0ABD6CGL1_9EURY|nr:hypothetical protein [Halorientalis brevis]
MTSQYTNRRRRGVRLDVADLPTKRGHGQTVLVGAPSLLHLGCRPGDIVEIQGTDITYARAAHSDPDEWHTGRIFMDTVVRHNAAVELDDTITIEPAKIDDASTVHVQYTTTRTETPSAGDRRQVESLLSNRGVFVGDLVPLFAIDEHDPPHVQITDVAPDSAGKITPDTDLVFDRIV